MEQIEIQYYQLMKIRNFKRTLVRAACFVAVGFFALLLVIVCAYAYVNHVGTHALEDAEQRLRVRGEPLTVEDIMRPPVPDEENFAATPLFREIVGDPDAVEYRIDSLPPFVGVGDAVNPGFVRMATDVDPGFEGSDAEAARFILAELENHETILGEVRSATHRPHTRWGIDYRRSPPWRFDQLNALIRLATILETKALAHLALDEPQQAFQETLVVLDLAERGGSPGLVISALVEQAILGIAVDVIAVGIDIHAWSDAELEVFEQVLARVNLEAQLRDALRGERVYFFQHFHGEALLNHLTNTAHDAADAADMGFFNRLAFTLWPSGWFKNDMATYALWVQDIIDAADPIGPHSPVAINDLNKEIEAVQQNLSDRLSRPFSIMGVPLLFDLVRRTARASSLLNMTRIACAVERYRLRHGVLPSALDELEMISELPLDPGSGESFRYTLESAEPRGWKLYSVGWDGLDDGGDFKSDHSSKAESRDWLWPPSRH